MGNATVKRFEAAGPRRVDVGVPPLPPAALWRAGETFRHAEADRALEAFAREALGREGFAPVAPSMLVRHARGDRGLPSSAPDGDVGFAIDLTDARRTLDGGLLLFVQSDGRLAGWRAERGMMTLWLGEDPELTELAPGAPDRLTLIGRAKAV